VVEVRMGNQQDIAGHSRARPNEPPGFGSGGIPVRVDRDAEAPGRRQQKS
jgi:hypothetical protein